MRARAWLVVAAAWLLACEGEGGGLSGQPDAGQDMAAPEIAEVGFPDTREGAPEAVGEVAHPDAPGEAIVPDADVWEGSPEWAEASAEGTEPDPEVVETADAPGEDVAPAPGLPAGFGMRVASLALTSPDLCYPSGATCVPLNGMVDAALGAALDDASEPLDLVGVFGTPAGDTTPFAFGSALCTHPASGPASCAPDPADPQGQALLDALALAPEVCPVGYTGPCFQAGPGDVLLDLPFFGGAFGLRQAVVMGVLDGVPAQTVEMGTIRGFLPRALARKYQVGGLGAEPLLVADVFPAQTEQLDGEPGWWVTLGYRGQRVDVVVGP